MARFFTRWYADHGPLIVAAFLLLIVGGAALTYSIYMKQLQEEMRARTEAAAEEIIRETRAAFSEVDLLTGGEAARLRTYRNQAHVDRAEQLGISSIPTRAAAEDLSEHKRIVRIEDNAYYTVRELDYSVPYVTENTARLLQLIGMRFQEALRERGLPPYRFVITSVTRTREDQRALRGVNVNAAVKSSHEFGTTVDLHYRDFSMPVGLNLLPDSSGIYHELLNERVGAAIEEMALTRQQKLKAILGRVLLELQAEDNVLVIYERRQPVYHITLGQPIATELIAEGVPTLESADDAPAPGP